MYFVFRDQGACATLLAVHVFYVTCPSVVTSLAAFVETPAGPDITSIVERQGVCVANSVASAAGRPSYLCKADGSWYFLSGGCQCVAGYEPLNDTSRCIGKCCQLLYLADTLMPVTIIMRLSHSMYFISFALIFCSSFPCVYAMRKCAPYMSSPFQSELMLLGYCLSHYSMVYFLVVLLMMCVCV